MSLPTAAVILL